MGTARRPKFMEHRWLNGQERQLSGVPAVLAVDRKRGSGSQRSRELAVCCVALIKSQSVHLISGRNRSPAGRRGGDSSLASGGLRGRNPATKESGVNESVFLSLRRRWGPGSQDSCIFYGQSGTGKPQQVQKPGRWGLHAGAELLVLGLCAVETAGLAAVPFTGMMQVTRTVDTFSTQNES